MALMHELSLRGFPWAECRFHTYACWAISSAVNLAFGGNFFYHAVHGNADFSWDVGPFVTALSAINYLGFVGRAFFFNISLSHVWVIAILMRLHRHDLFCYAAALARALHDPHPDDKMPSALEKLELTVTTRFRHASSTWVPLAMYIAIVMGSISLVIISILMVGVKLSYPWLFVLSLILSSSICSVILIALSFVAETFEYDVLRALNTPFLLKQAQMYFGQQLLPHLHVLEWGFRFGGSVLSARYVTNIVGGLFVGLVASISQAMLADVFTIS